MIGVILFQINFLAIALFTIFCANRKKKNGADGEGGDVSLVQPGAQKNAPAPTTTGAKPINDDFSVGVPLPNQPLADKSEERTMADIESIQSEKVQIRDKKMKSKLAAPGAPPKPAQSPGGGGGEKINVLRSPAAA
ncbi:uncharacterized protein CELE_Y39E4B.13 [Caenorhabditis elegans]|uniref:Uncharacterized protein n=1 Tax=Caenorhabditis elegans TaxID=6239 RepID=Q9U2L0_CAEEL|nr:Uncharacterized protein CELE_Y39E4B.13 [Caenorhabditis elegans]CAB54422.2 Uncharacterized protein CELE_Y39E4B.13 [Caenorhabditis elegans]|eukprot:NP_499712.2 Uncharacterized protein CELE_Y39E4B.13 [Caenorhabditis elegans]